MKHRNIETLKQVSTVPKKKRKKAIKQQPVGLNPAELVTADLHRITINGLDLNTQSHQPLRLPNHYIKQIGDQLQLLGVSQSHWLELSGVNQSCLDDRQGMLSFAQFRALILMAIKQSKEPALGLLVGHHLQTATHGMLGYAISASRNLHDTLALLSRYLSTRTPLIRVENRLLQEQSEIEIQLHECYRLGDIQRPFFESAIFTLYNLIQQISQGESRSPISRLCFPYPKPDYHRRYQAYFDCPISFDAPYASLCLWQGSLDKTLKMADETTLKQAKVICEQELKKYQMAETLAIQVRKYLLAAEEAFPSLTEVARHFNCSIRSLHRRLLKENSRYSQILASVRCYRAEHWLAQTDLTIAQIATQLGYSDPANFRKAFRRWKGLSPRDYRQQRDHQGAN